MQTEVLAKLLFALGGLIYVLIVHFAPAWREGRRARALNAGLVVMAAVSSLAYLKLPPFETLANRPLHLHDLSHYYLGAKYFPEMGYERLYTCFLEANNNSFGARTARDLRDKAVKPVEILLADPEVRCRPRFSPERWAQFASDARRLRSWNSDGDWQAFVMDHGFNPPPTWALAGHFLANRLDLTRSGIYGITLIDPLLLCLGFAVVAWAFGPALASLAVLGMTSFWGASATWTIGSFLRWDWLFWLLVAVAAARRNFPLLAGAAFGLSAAIRIFPAVGLPVLVLCGFFAYRARQPLQPVARFTAGAVAAMLLFALATLVPFEVAHWRQFFGNLSGLTQTFAANFMGLRSVLTFLWSAWAAGAWQPTDAALNLLKIDALKAVWWVHLPIALGVLALCATLHRLPLWALLLAALAWIPFYWGEVSSYYFMFWGCLFLLAGYRPILALPLALCNLAGALFAAWLGETPLLYVLLSAGVCGAGVAAVLMLRREAAPAQPAAIPA